MNQACGSGTAVADVLSSLLREFLKQKTTGDFTRRRGANYEVFVLLLLPNVCT
jgi:hypothetical protein